MCTARTKQSQFARYRYSHVIRFWPCVSQSYQTLLHTRVFASLSILFMNDPATVRTSYCVFQLFHTHQSTSCCANALLVLQQPSLLHLLTSKTNAAVGNGAEQNCNQWKKWVAVREALCPCHPWRYCEDQLEYHYTKRAQVLERSVARLA